MLVEDPANRCQKKTGSIHSSPNQVPYILFILFSPYSGNSSLSSLRYKMRPGAIKTECHLTIQKYPVENCCATVSSVLLLKSQDFDTEDRRGHISLQGECLFPVVPIKLR